MSRCTVLLLVFLFLLISQQAYALANTPADGSYDDNIVEVSLTVEDFLNQGQAYLKEAKPYEALSVFTEGYALTKNQRLFEGIITSGRIVLSWCIGSHGRGEFLAATKGYSLLLSNPFIPKTGKRVIQDNLVMANNKQTLDLKAYRKNLAAHIIVDTSKATYTYEEMKEDINDLIFLYGDLIKVNTIGKSLLGNDLPVIVLGNNQAEKKLLVHGSTHAREYMTTLLMMKQLEYYLENYHNGTYKGESFSNILAKALSIIYRC